MLWVLLYVDLVNNFVNAAFVAPKVSFFLFIIYLICRMYTEVHVEDVAISLFIKKMSDDYSGDYTCQATYAGNKQLSSSVSLSTFREFTNVL